MKPKTHLSTSIWRYALILLAVTVMASGSSKAALPANFGDDMKAACPLAWEDLSVAINSALPNSDDIWNADDADRDAFVAFYSASHTASAQQVQLAADDLAVVAKECAAQRVAVLDSLMQRTPLDVSQALTTAGQSIQTSGDRWQTGDVRVTGRSIAATGWVFLTGQTVGPASTSATLAGDEYRDLYELAKGWAPNTGSENWGAAQTVTLPDMRGRGLFGADNMGGQSANVISSAAADKVGGAFGAEKRTLSVAQMPSHNHTSQAAGNHSHGMSSAGNHTHKMPNIRPYLNLSAGSGYQSPWYRSGADLSTSASGNHTHAISPGGNHAHTINNTGGSQPVFTISPGIVFNVEMKY